MDHGRTRYLQLVSSFPRGRQFPSAELPPAAAWLDEISVGLACSLCPCSACPGKTHSASECVYSMKHAKIILNLIMMWWHVRKRTLYSKQDTQIVRSSRSLLSCEGGISTVQRWIRLLSAFFITHKKHTSRCRLVSAARAATDLPWHGEEILLLLLFFIFYYCYHHHQYLKNLTMHIQSVEF